MPDLSIVIPVYNEEKNILLLYDRVCESLSNTNKTWELLFVNDGSWDESLNIIKALSNNDERVKLINFTRNFGQQAALTAGMDFAKGKALVTMDCDLQDPPELIPQMIDEWEKGALVVFGRRKSRKDGFFKKTTAKLYYSFLKQYSDVKITGNIGDFRLIDYKVLCHLNNMREKSRYLRGMVAWLGFKYEIIDYDRPNRINGETGFSLLKMVRLAMDGILNFSLLPLRLGMIIGLLNIFIGLSFLVYILIDSLVFDQYYPLYKWLIVVLFMLVGFLFILIWILAEYIGKIYDESKSRPLYVVHDMLNLTDE